MPPATATTAIPPSTHQQPLFEGAPITKLCCIVWVVGHVALSSKNKSSLFWFDSTGELVMGLLFLAQQLKYLERELSSRQLIVWLLWITGGAALFEWTWRNLLALGDDDVHLASGPYPWMGAILYWYIRFVPRLYPRFVSVLGMALSEKALQFIWAVYLLASQGMASILPGVEGFLVAALYFGVVPHYLPLTLPDILVNGLPWESFGGLLFLDPPPKVYVPLVVAAMQQQQHAPYMDVPRGRRQQQQQQQQPVARAPSPPQPPSPEAIEQLTAMGFPEDQVRQALQQTNNNVERAADRLLMG